MGSNGYSVAIKKVACDQIFFAPTFLTVILITIGICQGKDIEKLKIKLANEYSEILMNNYKVTNTACRRNFNFFFLLFFSWPSALFLF